jgi:hypothetical protein
MIVKSVGVTAKVGLRSRERDRFIGLRDAEVAGSIPVVSISSQLLPA